MAEVILGSVVESITRHLLSLISEEIGLACSVRLELEKLYSTVSIISGVLCEAEKRQVEAEDVKEWLKRLRDMAYDADDLLDDFSTEVLRHRKVTGGGNQFMDKVCIFSSSSSPKQLTCGSRMARQVMDIRERLEAIRNDCDHFQLGRISNFRSLVENPTRSQTYPFEPEPNVIGREEDKKKVIDFLLDPNFEENVSILPIVGFGGMGKTTLARLVYNDESVKEYFELKLWVCVPINFNVEDVLRKIVREGSRHEELGNVNMNGLANKDPRDLREELANLDMNELHKRLGAKLDGKRFLLVLDDIWNENRCKWLELQKYLTLGAKGSKILVTTRTPRVARTMAPVFHELSGLPEHESFSLLMRMAMKQEHEWRSQNLEMIAKEILKKCAGVPLAIMTVGRLLLFSRNTEEDWLDFNTNDLSRINQEEDDIMPSLKLSYDFLPSHLKQCFAYCSLFPKDYELNPSELIHLWMAQGFVKSSGNTKTLESVGQQYFMELVSRSFFQDLKEDIYGDIIGCKMHDLMHDLAMLVAGDCCITINSSHKEMKIPKSAQHVSVVDMEDYEPRKFDESRRIRSILFTVDYSKRIEISLLDIYCFRNLRVLRLHDAKMEVISSSICELKHLRSLDLSWNRELTWLPNSISRLCNLETFNLKGCWNLRRLPRGTTKLFNLRLLDVSGCDALAHMPRGIGKLNSLQMLGKFVVGKKRNRNVAKLNELSRLNGLRNELIIEHLERLGSISSEMDASFSIDKFAIQSLKLRWRMLDGEDFRANNDEEVLERFQPHLDLKGLEIYGYCGVRLPSWVSQLHKLVKIEISGCHWCKHLPPIDHLPLLKSISLIYLKNLEWIELSETGMPQQSFFPSLEVLELNNLHKFRGWERRRRDSVSITEEGGKGEEEEEQGSSSSSLSMLHTFSDKVKVTIIDCWAFSCVVGQQLRLGVATMENLRQLQKDIVRQDPHTLTPQLPTAQPNPLKMMMLISKSSISLSALTSLSIHELEDAEHLPAELFQNLPNLESLAIGFCPRLKSLPVKTILRYLAALKLMRIHMCEELDLSMEDNNGDGGSEGTDHLQLHDHGKLSQLIIIGVRKMESLPMWFQHLSNLKELHISSCGGLKSLPGRLILQLLTTLVSLRLIELDSIEVLEDQEDITNLEFHRPTKLRELAFVGIKKMKALPWWMQHVTNLEILILIDCKNLKALPEWFAQLTSLKILGVLMCGGLSRRCKRETGKDWPKISHILSVHTRPICGVEDAYRLYKRLIEISQSLLN